MQTPARMRDTLAFRTLVRDAAGAAAAQAAAAAGRAVPPPEYGALHRDDSGAPATPPFRIGQNPDAYRYYFYREFDPRFFDMSCDI